MGCSLILNFQCIAFGKYCDEAFAEGGTLT
jgi:hypothetical protein